MSSSPTASYTYAQAGTYQITLTVTDATGVKTTTAHAVTVPSTGTNTPQPPPTPPVTSGGTNPTASIALTSQSYTTIGVSGAGSAKGSAGAAISTYAWSFGDGGTATGVTASHTYTATGTYSVSLTVTDSGSRTGSTTQNVSVTAKVNQAPVASFVSSATKLVVAFDGSKSTDADGTIASYHWNFGDSTTAITTTSTTSHTYSTDGTYKPTLTVIDNSGASSAVVTGSITVTVAGATQPTGTNITPIQLLTPKATKLTSQINDAPATNYVSFDVATYSWSDFAVVSTDNYSGRGVDMNVPIGILGSGAGKTVFEMVAGSTTKYTAPGAKSFMTTGETTNLHYFWCESQTKKLDGFTLQGQSIGSLDKRYDGSASTNGNNSAKTASPYVYNGLYLHELSNATVSNIHVNGIPGSDRVNPGETFAIAFQHCSGMTFDTVQINSDATGTTTPSGATGFGGNFHTGTLVIKDSEAENCRYSAGIALYACSGTATITNFESKDNYRHLNFEQNTKGMVVDVVDPVFGATYGTALYFGANSDVSGAGSIKFTMHDPVDTNGNAITSLNIQCSATYSGGTNLQKQSDIKILVNGKDKTSSIVNWS